MRASLWEKTPATPLGRSHGRIKKKLREFKRKKHWREKDQKGIYAIGDGKSNDEEKKGGEEQGKTKESHLPFSCTDAVMSHTHKKKEDGGTKARRGSK